MQRENQGGKISLAAVGARSRRVSALAARRPLVHNLWSLFVRRLEPSRHVEAAGSRRWEQLKASYTRVAAWLAATAPQLKIPLPLPLQTALALA